MSKTKRVGVAGKRNGDNVNMASGATYPGICDENHKDYEFTARTALITTVSKMRAVDVKNYKNKI